MASVLVMLFYISNMRGGGGGGTGTKTAFTLAQSFA